MRRLAIALIFIPGLASAQSAFQTPSGNIHCGMEEGSLRCDIQDSSFTRPPRPRDCEVEFGD